MAFFGGTGEVLDVSLILCQFFLVYLPVLGVASCRRLGSYCFVSCRFLLIRSLVFHI
jgi:hypothetical protein